MKAKGAEQSVTKLGVMNIPYVTIFPSVNLLSMQLGECAAAAKSLQLCATP